VQPPSLETNRIGTAKTDDLIGPGYLNWDIAINRDIPLGDMRRLQFRVELYNAFNTVQFSDVDTGAVFDEEGNQIDGQFGAYLAARDARRAQLTLRLQF
jgi:hypothetical protein